MKFYLGMLSLLVCQLAHSEPAAINHEVLAKGYFQAWTKTQNPNSTVKDVVVYLEYLTDDVGHQHLPYDQQDVRKPDNKRNMLEGMKYYLGAHVEYRAKLTDVAYGYNVIVIKYDTYSKGVHPQTKELVEQSYATLEVLELEDGKISMIRKYSE